MFGSDKIISYIYDASGSKLEKKVMVTGISQTTEYLGGFQYASSNAVMGAMQMDFFPTAEGYVKLTEGKHGMVYNYVYIYIVISEGSRLFPPRNLIPIP